MDANFLVPVFWEKSQVVSEGRSRWSLDTQPQSSTRDLSAISGRANSFRYMMLMLQTVGIPKTAEKGLFNSSVPFQSVTHFQEVEHKLF